MQVSKSENKHLIGLDSGSSPVRAELCDSRRNF
jgi:hypothetical protein